MESAVLCSHSGPHRNYGTNELKNVLQYRPLPKRKLLVSNVREFSHKLRGVSHFKIWLQKLMLWIIEVQFSKYGKTKHETIFGPL